jgi:hypothetical protein
MNWKSRIGRAAGIGFIFFAAAANRASAVSLPDLAVAVPSSNPTLSAGMNTFNPPVDAQAVPDGAPIIASSNLTVQPDQSLTITGTRLTSSPGAAVFADTRFIIFGQTHSDNGTVSDAQIQTITPSGAIITVEAREPSDSMYLLWPVNSRGAGLPVALNQTQAWWIGAPGEIVPTDSGTGGVSIASGRTMSIFGRNLTNGAANPQSWVYLQSTTGGRSFWPSVTAANSYKVDFTVSTPGTYQVWVNNGLGGNYSWSEVTQVRTGGRAPQLLTVTAAAPAWSNDPASIINVKNEGATGNGVMNDDEAIQKAIGALHQGSTLYFPAGTYLVSNGEQLRPPPGVRVMGDGPGKSVLIFNEPVPVSGFGGFTFGWPDHQPINVEVDGMTFDYVGTSNGGAVLRAGDGYNIVLHDVQVIGNSIQSLFLQGSDGVSIDDSSFQGLDINGLAACDMFIHNTRFNLAYGAIAAISFWGAHNDCITDCTIRNSDDSIRDNSNGAGRSRFIEYNLDWGSIYNQYVADNTTSLGQPIPDNTGEQINCEGDMERIYHGPPVSWTATSVTIPGQAFIKYGYPIGTRVVITDGTGIGQMRSLVAFTVNHDAAGAVASIEIDLDRPWNVNPDSSSTLYVGGLMSESAFYQNSLQDALDPPNWAANAHAASGINIATDYDVVIDGNSTKNLASAISLASLGDYSAPIFYIDVQNNHLDSCRGTAVLFGLWDDDFKFDPNYIGVAIRGNTITNSPAGVDLAYAKLGSSVLTLIEGNTISTARGLCTYNDPLTLVRKNIFAAPELGPGTEFYPQAIVYAQYATPTAPPHNPIGPPTVLLRDNSFQGYAPSNKYFSLSPDYGLPAPTLAAPYNVIFANVNSGGNTPVTIPLWNAGPAPLPWSGSTNVPWLALNPSKGSIPDENTTGRVSLIASAANLTAGDYSGLVTIVYTAGGASIPKTFTVHLKVN